MKNLLLFFAIICITISCSSDNNPEPEPIKNTISSEFIGTWKIVKKRNVTGAYIDNTDASLYVKISSENIDYKLTNGTFSGFGTVEHSNADKISLSNGTVVYLFKTIQGDGTQNFTFQHSNGMLDDVMVKKL